MSTHAESTPVGAELIHVVVNGQTAQAPAGVSVFELLEQLAIASDRVAVELNKELVRKRDWHTTRVPDGAQIEVVEFVGGG